MPSSDAALQRLYDLVKERKNTPDLPKSYTVSLFKKGRARIAQKLGEEAVETVIAAMKGDKHELVNEISDLIFHLFVLMADTGVDLEDVIVELQKRRMKRDHDRD